VPLGLFIYSIVDNTRSWVTILLFYIVHS